MVAIIPLAVAVSSAVSGASSRSAISTQTLMGIGLAVLYAWTMLDLWRSGRLK